MKKNTVRKTAPINRAGLTDIWNAFMVENATFSPHDIPLCPTTAKKIPSKLIGYDEAKTIHKKNLRNKSDNYHVNAFIHFYIDDSKFDGKQSSFWLYPEKVLEMISHFDGIILPDPQPFTTLSSHSTPNFPLPAFPTAHRPPCSIMKTTWQGERPSRGLWGTSACQVRPKCRDLAGAMALEACQRGLTLPGCFHHAPPRPVSPRLDLHITASPRLDLHITASPRLDLHITASPRLDPHFPSSRHQLHML